MSPDPVRSHTLTAADGSGLYVGEFGAEDAPRTLVLVHGYGEHGGRYHQRMRTFEDAEYRVLLPDVRGHGRSTGPRGHVLNWADYHSDLSRVLDLVRTPPERTGIVGHSNGGLIVASWLVQGQSTVGAAALTSPFLGLGLKPPAWKEAAAKVLGRLVPRLSLPSEIDPEVLSHDPVVVDRYRTDPLNHHVNNSRWYLEALDAMEHTRTHAERITQPTLVMQSGDDRLVSVDAARSWALAAPAATYEEIPDAYHELLFEVDGDKHTRRLLAWFDEHLGD